MPNRSNAAVNENIFPAPYVIIPIMFLVVVADAVAAADLIKTATAAKYGYYKTPLVEGNTILFTSRFTAIFIDLAKALNIASIL